MKQITMNIRPIEEAEKNDRAKLSWQGNRPVLIGWAEKTRTEFFTEPWYKLWFPNHRTVDDGSGWYFVNFNPVTAQYEYTVPCGLFVPEVFAELPMLCHAKESEQ
jgi:hypothetical protein